MLFHIALAFYGPERLAPGPEIKVNNHSNRTIQILYDFGSGQYDHQVERICS
jgi:hypothetical protein